MITRLTWMVISPLGRKEFNSLVTSIQEDQFTSQATSGFILDSLRTSSLEGRFIQRLFSREVVIDPFGNETDVERTEYIQTTFRLSADIPQLEIVNSPRSLNLFINRLGELTDGKSAIYSPTVAVNKWLEAFSEQPGTLTTTGLLITDLQLGPMATAKVAIQGSDDVRKHMASFIGKRNHSIKEAQIEFADKNDQYLKITLRSGCRFTVKSNDAPNRAFLRKLVSATMPAVIDNAGNNLKVP